MEPEPLTLAEKRAWLERELTRERSYLRFWQAMPPPESRGEARYLRRTTAAHAYYATILEAELTRIGAPE